MPGMARIKAMAYARSLNLKVWIIGASEGIGAALAREYHRRGAELVLSARSVEKLESLSAELGGGHRVVPLDVTDRAALDAAAEEVGPLDMVIMLAATYDPARLDELSPESAERIVSVNVMGSFNVAQVAPRVLRKGGQLVLFGSVAGYFGLPRGQLYSATKAAIINMAESLRVEYAPDIRVRLVCPGFVRTRLTEKNDFEMPSLLTPEEAARATADGLEGNGFEVHFPRSLTWKLKVLRAMPYRLAFRVVARLGA
jgi:NAD(P)-dependent dehydrogenase (short-subunit alcohol dehydrogenase family)